MNTNKSLGKNTKMNMFLKKKQHVVYCLLLLFCSSNLYAKHEVYQEKISGTSIQTGTVLTIKDIKYPTGNSNSSWIASNDIRSQLVKNVITLRVNYNYSGSISPFSSTVKFNIQYKDENGDLKTIENKELTVEYQPNIKTQYPDRSSFIFDGGHLVNITITDVDGISPALSLENTIYVDRLYKFDRSAPSIIRGADGVIYKEIENSGEYEIRWKSRDGAEEYQLEWLHVNDYEGTELSYDFNKNSTRISTKDTVYKVSSLFEQGYVLFRVRAISYEELSKKHVLIGRWSCENGSKCSGSNVKQYEDTIQISKYKAHTTDSINWQYITNYAEEGKKKEVITYYDGSMRSQQMVTRINSDNNTVIGETYYDYHGRPVIQSLPVPADNDAALRFYKDFNKNPNDSAYNKINFDKSVEDPCSVLADSMKTTSGASKYYSSANNNKNNFNQFIPDADKFPFSQVEYEPDNTGRIRRQGGVGKEYQLGSRHEVKYFYGTAEQDYLNRLFGSEVGYDSLYQKNMVMDANGQLSVSYLDSQGRIIATALAGNPASGLEAIATNKQNKKDTMTISIVDNQYVRDYSSALTATYHHLVNTEGDYDFKYNLPGINFKQTGYLPEDVCLGCAYDLIIDIKDECGISPKLEGDMQLPIVMLQIGNLENLCDETQVININLSFTAKDLKVGKYIISRKLSINQDGLSSNIEAYLQNNLINIKLEDIIDEQIAKIDFSGCVKLDCKASCLEQLGENASEAELAYCMANCEFPDMCEATEKIMIGDFMPGSVSNELKFDSINGKGNQQVMGGQYALYEVTQNNDGTFTYSAYDEVSIFQKNKLDEILNSNIGYLFKDTNGNKLTSDNIEGFIDNFTEEWAKALSEKYHPERCKLDDCKEKRNLAGLQYDFLMRNTDTYDEANQLGLLNPLGMVGYPGIIAQRDSFFLPGGKASIKRDEFVGFMAKCDSITNDELEGEYVYLSLWQKAALLAGVCRDSTTMDCIDILGKYFNNPDICNKDAVWNYFRVLYQNKKNAYYDVENYTDNGPGCNNCVGNGRPDEGCGAYSSHNPYALKEKRFFKQSDILTGEQMDIVNGSVTEYETAQAGALEGMKQNCLFQAESQVNYYLDQIESCASLTTGAQWNDTNPKYNDLKKAFVNVMTQACQSNTNVSIFGASSLPAGVNPEHPNVDQNFKAAMLRVLNINEDQFTLYCNPDLISLPDSSYTYNSLNKYKVIDTCACNQFLQADKEFKQNPAGYASNKAYYEAQKEKSGLTLTVNGFQAKVCLCERAYGNMNEWNEFSSWSEDGKQMLAESGEFVPIEISCSTCQDCNTVKAAITEFYTKKWTQAFKDHKPEDPHGINYLKIMITNFLNHKFSLNLNYTDYADFMKNCEDAEVAPVCTIIPGADYIRKFLNELELRSSINTKTCINQYKDLEKAFIELLKKTYPSINLNDCTCKDWIIEPVPGTSTPNSVTMRISSPTCSIFECDMTLKFVDTEKGYDINSIVYFEEIRVAPDNTPQNTGSFLMDVLVVHNGQTVPATMHGVSCIPIAICKKPEELTLCNPVNGENVDTEDDCKWSLIHGAITNSERLYKGYRDSIVTDFRNRYTKQCLTTAGKESFNMKYEDNEHHYTLYYYDQAGNLVKTVPPEGVEFIHPSLFPQINKDREKDTCTVFSNHRMETRYLYNSLNQLVAQYMPDHDAFEDVTLADRNIGLPANLNVTATKFTTDLNGVIFGTLPQNPMQSVGYITNDGGQTWVPVQDLGLNNLNDIFILSGANTIYVAGDNGTLLKTIDGGATWTAINSGTTEHLKAVYMRNSYTGYLFTKSGKIRKTFNSGVNWDPLSGTGLEALTSLEHVYYKNNDLAYAVGYKGNYGAIYKSEDGGEHWEQEDLIVTSDLFLTQMYNENTIYAFGEDGQFLRADDNVWQRFNTTNRTDFTKARIVAPNKAMALTTSNKMLESNNGGVTWNETVGLLNDKLITDFSYINGVTYAIDNDNKLYKLSYVGNWTDLNTTVGAGTLNSIYFEDSSTGYVGGDAGTIFRIMAGEVNWTQLETQGSTGIDIKQIMVNKRNSTLNPETIATIITKDNLVYNGKILTSGAVTIAPVASLTGVEVISIAFGKEGNGYLLTKDGYIWKTTDAGNSWLLAQTNQMSELKAINVLFQDPTKGVAVGKNGTIYTTFSSFATMTSQKILPHKLRSIQSYGNTTVAVGDKGTVLWNVSGTKKWKLLPTPFINDLHTISIPAENSILATGGSGILYKNADISTVPNSWEMSAIDSHIITAAVYDYSSNNYFTANNNGNIQHQIGAMFYNLPISNYTINDIAINGNEAWVVGNNGKIYKTVNFQNNSLTSWDPVGNAIRPSKVIASAKRPDGKLFAVTTSGAIGTSTDGSIWNFPSTPVTTQKLNTIEFLNNSIGIAAGDRVILKTTTGGDHWEVIFTPNRVLNAVCFIDNNNVCLAGDDGIIYKLNLAGNTLIQKSVSLTSKKLNSITFSAGIGFIAGNDGTILKSIDNGDHWELLKAPNGTNWTAYTDPTHSNINVHLNSIEAIDQKTIYVAGNEGVVLKTIDGGITWNRKDSQTTEDLNQIAFRNKSSAVISGTNGTVVNVTDESDKFSARFYYDKLGRLVASQNSKQHHYEIPRYSYTSYDALGRVIEVGELESNRTPEEINLNDSIYPNNWSTLRYEVTRTQFDYPLSSGISNLFSTLKQENLRNRIASVIYQEKYDQDSTIYNHATHYSYDIHGNVKELIQDNPELKYLGQQHKNILYEYDLVSGNVNKVSYQPGNPDQFYHKYEYDADNRIVSVFTSLDGLLWDNDATYQYYKHGPLARTELGDLKVQGLDYAYTLQGWIKGVNTNSLETNTDMGKDGNNVAKDAFGYSLHYNSNDYKAIGGSTSEAFLAAVASGSTSSELYNGNISKMATAISGMDNLTKTYGYDELNRLLSSKTYESGIETEKYNTAYTYDANGNILALNRNGNKTDSLNMDNLSYHYQKDGMGRTISNRLLNVNDPVDAGYYGEDIDDQGTFVPNNTGTHNYKYDKIGNLIADKQEEIARIEWNAMGKISEIIRVDKPNQDKPNLRFAYDALGNRVSKTVIYPNISGNALPKEIITYYVRDTKGNVIAVYEKKLFNNNTEELFLSEQHLYGSSRLGMLKSNVLLATRSNNTTTTNPDIDLALSSRELGSKYFELTNHLGNVLAVVSDKRLPNNQPDIKQVYDYYPFGQVMPGRYNYDPGNDYRYGFGGHEKDDELKSNGNYLAFGDYGYDPRLGRRFRLDPVDQIYISNYAVFRNNPIALKDPDGETPIGAVLEGIGAFVVSAGIDFLSNWIFGGDDYQTAFNNINWGAAAFNGVTTAAISFFVDGTGTARMMSKVANSKAGRFAIDVVQSMTTSIIGKIESGTSFRDIDLTEELLTATFSNLLLKGMGKRADELLESLKDNNTKLYTALNKLRRNTEAGKDKARIKSDTHKAEIAKENVNASAGKYAAEKTKNRAVSSGVTETGKEVKKKVTSDEESND